MITEKIVLNDDCRYVGQDGFVVPKNFEEFYERYPGHVRKWLAGRKLHTIKQTEIDLEDWVSELTLKLATLPINSEYRKMGFEDAVATFDPYLHFGASAPRFWNYINICLNNCFNTALVKLDRDASSKQFVRSSFRKDSIFPRDFSANFYEEQDDWVHDNSAYLREMVYGALEIIDRNLTYNQLKSALISHDPRLVPFFVALESNESILEGTDLWKLRRAAIVRASLLSKGQSLPLLRKTYRKWSEEEKQERVLEKKRAEIRKSKITSMKVDTTKSYKGIDYVSSRRVMRNQAAMKKRMQLLRIKTLKADAYKY